MIGSDDIRTYIRDNPDCAKVEVVTASGSTPREQGTWMLVSQVAQFQTIGGGQLEYMAIDRARAMLKSKLNSDRMSVPLGPEIGQCCGGRVEIAINRLDKDLINRLITETDRRIADRPHVYLFGAGHVGNALARALALLPVRTVLVDTRSEELEQAPVEVETCLTAVPESIVRSAPPQSAFVVLTHDHSLDFLIVSEVLARDDAVYVGMIGSKTKKATFNSWYRKQSGSDIDRLGQLVCPIGRSVSKDKRPAVIASLVAAELIEALSASAAMPVPAQNAAVTAG